MTIFQLLIYSCATLSNLSGDLISKTCRWDTRQLFANEGSCSTAGAAEMGRPIFSDVYENRVAEKFRCSPISVIQ